MSSMLDITPIPLPIPTEMVTLKDLLLQTPSLCVLVIVVGMFLRFMERQRKDYTTLIGRLHEEHIDARSSTREVMGQNAHAILEVTKAIHVLAEVTRQCNPGFKNPIPSKP